MTKSRKTRQELLDEVETLRARLEEAEETLRAIRSGEVDALVIEKATGMQIFTLKGADYPYRMIVENISEGAVTLLPDGTIVYANQRFADMLGFALQKIMGSFFHYFVHESGKKDFLILLANGLTGKQKGEFLLCTPSDTYLPVSVSINPLPIDGQTSATMVITDLTEQKRREDLLDFEVRKRTSELENVTAELKAQNLELQAIQQQLEEEQRALEEGTAKLEEMNREMESFSYSVSHDLRAPLRAIDGYSRMILRKQGDKFDEDTVRKFKEIRMNTQMMGRLIDDLLAFSRLGRMEISKSKLDVAPIIQEVWKELRTINPGREMVLILNSLPVAYGNSTLIKQVYFNILSNAVKFTKHRQEARIEAGGSNEGGEAVFYVKDNGIGFNMAYYDKLFGIFQRLHNNPDFEGTGVGLASVQRIIQRHGGRVWAEGKVNEGATFCFSLP